MQEFLDPAEEELLQALRQLDDVVDARHRRTFDVDSGWDRVQKRVAGRAQRRQAARVLRTRRIRIASFAVAAAAVLVVVSQMPRPVQINSPQLIAELHEARRGASDTVVLRDGTIVILDAGSTLRVSAEFGRERRDVTLQGRAHFRVKPDSLRAFHVHAAGTVTRVLGTQFTVVADTASEVVEVAVAEGRVSFAAAPDSLRRALLVKGDVGRITGNTLSVQHNVSLAQFGWIEGVREFRRVRLREAIPQLERWYDVKIVVVDTALLSERISADLTGVVSDVAIPELAQLMSANATRNGSTWHLQVVR